MDLQRFTFYGLVVFNQRWTLRCHYSHPSPRLRLSGLYSWGYFIKQPRSWREEQYRSPCKKFCLAKIIKKPLY
ncbi:hypothetical protein I7I53_09426 [Histoplasma capsulatum var. duboisii H88]|uniref:Uncharacterized protein n=1 Tax=Ajellomyces capsulatus (strain H88) TaxID=544711 RepID=A0A8A1L5B7_AJEC8|nr:hypothetical protein I7I53_09426 [Histoplasma capsulatum var. duboisii H88]